MIPMRRLSILMACVAALSACSLLDTVNEGSRIDYKSAGKLPPLDT